MKRLVILLALAATHCMGQAFTFFDLPMLAGEPPVVHSMYAPNLIIVKALWATELGTNAVDVTGIFSQFATNNGTYYWLPPTSISLCTFSTNCSDPDPGVAKQFSIAYLLDSEVRTNVTASEAEVFCIPAPVSNLVATVSNSTTIRLTWQPPPEQPGTADKYLDYAIFQGTDSWFVPTNNYIGTNLTDYATDPNGVLTYYFDATGLTHGTTYYFYVRSHYNAGNSGSIVGQAVYSSFGKEVSATP